ncbi:FAD-dependent oxidoreductase [Chloroflexota bacterium]
MTRIETVTNKEFPYLFQPGQIARVKLKNRIVMFPMGTAYGSAVGEVTRRTIDYYAARAKGGAGLIIVGNCSAMGRLSPNSLQLDADWYLARHSDLVEAVHAWGAKIAVQLNHAGSRAQISSLEGRQAVSASAVPRVWREEESYPEPRPMSKEEIYQVMGKFAEAAARAKQAGYDFVEIHGAHGYLVGQFMSPALNWRTDEFGGSFENRMRFPLQLFRKVKEKVGEDYPVGIRLSADEFLPGGITLEESTRTAKLFEEAGAVYISVGSGTFETYHRMIDLMRDAEDWKVPLCAAMKKVLKVPTIAGGNLRHPDFCEQFLAEGKGDFIGLARALYADPEWPDKARDDRVEDIRCCVTCNECMRTSQKSGGRGNRRCSVNAAAGREREFGEIMLAVKRKKVMVVGGGPGGMEAARIAALRGHEVTLYDKAGRLGEGLYLAAAPPGKEKWLWLRDFLETQLQKLGVKVVLNTTVDAGLVQRFKPDAVIVATGAAPLLPDIPGVGGGNMVQAREVLLGKVALRDKNILIVGGATVGAETAEYLAERGNRVTIIEMLSRLADDMERLNRSALMSRLEELKVALRLGTQVKEIHPDGATVVDIKTGKEKHYPADVVILAVGARSHNQLTEAIRNMVPELYEIGDCAAPRMIINAVYEGALYGRWL